MRHEQAAAHAADGYARSTGKVGVCFATSGPGATNLLTGLMTAQRDSSPVVAITGQAPTSVLGTDAFQEVDITSITAPVTKHNYLVSDAWELPGVMREAFHIARTGRPGPVLVSVTANAQTMPIEFIYPDGISLPGYSPTRRPNDDSPLGEDAAKKVSRESWDESIQGDIAAQDKDESIKRFIARQIDLVTEGQVSIISDLEPGRKRQAPHPLCDERMDLNSITGPMTPGSALPAAIGVQIGHPNDPVWILAENASFQASIQELATVFQEKLCIKIAIVNHSCSGSWSLPGSNRDSATGILGPDFVQAASAYGIPGLRVHSMADIEPAIAEAMACDGPFLLMFGIVGDSTCTS